MKYYYKIIQKLSPIGEIIDTDNSIDELRFKRNKELLTCFEKAYSFSEEFELPISVVLTEIALKITPLPNNFLKRITYIWKLYFLTNEMKKCSLQYSEISKYSLDFILEKTRICIQNETKTILPSRFKSSFFFESEDDCKRYYTKYNYEGEIFIAKVEFIESKEVVRFDNNIISYFSPYATSVECLNQAKSYLSGNMSDNPLIEFVFQGKYKIIDVI
jgi:hypothetical protein